MRRSVLLAVTITSFLTPFTLSSVNVALPAIAFQLKANTNEMNWIATSFLISSAIFLLPFGGYLRQEEAFHNGNYHLFHFIFACGFFL